MLAPQGSPELQILLGDFVQREFRQMHELRQQQGVSNIAAEQQISSASTAAEQALGESRVLADRLAQLHERVSVLERAPPQGPAAA